MTLTNIISIVGLLFCISSQAQVSFNNTLGSGVPVPRSNEFGATTKRLNSLVGMVVILSQDIKVPANTTKVSISNNCYIVVTAKDESRTIYASNRAVKITSVSTGFDKYGTYTFGQKVRARFYDYISIDSDSIKGAGCTYGRLSDGDYKTLSANQLMNRLNGHFIFSESNNREPL